METIKELNTNELEQVNGGLKCFIFGYSSGTETVLCYSEGKENEGGAAACAYIGVGLGTNIYVPNED